jgi:hypothetical protein
MIVGPPATSRASTAGPGENAGSRRALQTGSRAALQTGAAIGLLAALILIIDGGSLNNGLFMDDYAHFQQLQESDWSLAGLTNACRLELVGGVLDLWFLPDCTLRFFRPLAFGTMKLLYTLGNWNPVVLHAASLSWHLLACTLLMFLLRRLGAARWLAWGVAALFAVHPGLLTTIHWIACQTELMVTASLLGAMLCYLRFRGWSKEERSLAGRARYIWAAGCLALFLVALGCRENAIMFPLVVLPVELLLWRRRTREMLLFYAILCAVSLAYLALRASYLSGAALPPKPYVYTPSDPGFARYIFDKVCYYLLGEFMLAPIVPFGGEHYLRERPLMFYGLAAVVLALLVVVSLRFSRRKPGLVGVAWLLFFMGPVLPSFASPHHLYLPAVGWAIATMLILRGIGGAAAEGSVGPPWPPSGDMELAWRAKESEVCGTVKGGAAHYALRWRQGIMWASLFLLGGAFITLSITFRLPLDAAQRVEDQVATEVASYAGQMHDGDALYVANLPIIAHYVRLAVEYRTGLRDLHVCGLTWAPRVLGLVDTDLDSEITWVDDRTIEVRLGGDRYFGGPLGRLVSEASGHAVPAQTAQSAARSGFRAQVLEGDADGVQALRFTFERPLSDPHVHLFWGSPIRWAARLDPPGQ